MDDGMLDRINELYNKEKTEGLTEEEQEEQTALRKAYLTMFRQNLKTQLDNIEVENPDGTIESLAEAHERSMKDALGINESDLEDSDETEAESNLANSSDSEE